MPTNHKKSNFRGRGSQAAPEVCPAGEAALASSKLFRDYHLRLYRYTWFYDQHVDYIIETEQAAVLGVNLVDAGGPTFQAGSTDTLSVLQIPREHMKAGRVDKLLSTLSGLLERSQLVSHPTAVIKPIPMEHHARMAKLRMIQRRNGHIWAPTWYGLSLGIVDGYLPSDNGKPLHTLFILPGYKDKLDMAMSWGQLPPVPIREQLSWEQTLKRACQGLPRSDGHAAGVARAFASMPLSEYMASNKEELETLRMEFGELATYQEAADRIFRLCMDCDGSPEASDLCMDLIFALSSPVLQALKAVPRPIH